MKRNIIITLLVFGVVGTAGFFLFGQGIKDKISHSFETGNVQKMAPYFSESILLTMYDDQEYEGTSDVSQKLSSFFEQYPSKDFKTLHYRKKEHKNSFYMVGIYQATEEVFRINVLIYNEKIDDINISFESPLSVN